MVVLYCLRRMGSLHSPPLDAVTRDLILFCHRRNISFVPVHIPGKLNVVADQGSRQGPISTEWMLDPESFESICQEFPFFPTVDLFATRATSRLTCYVSPCPDPQAFHQDALDPFLDWNQFPLIYAFPPPGLMPFLFKRIVRFRGAMLLIVPLNLNSTWILILAFPGGSLSLPVCAFRDSCQADTGISSSAPFLPFTPLVLGVRALHLRFVSVMRFQF